MFVEPPARRPRWPGWDGGLLLLLGLLALVTWLLRGRLGGEHGLLLMLVVDVAWLAVTWSTRRAPRLVEPDFRPLVVIPTHNNQGTIADVARRCLAHLPDVVVLDDGSSDETAARAAEVPGVTLLRHRVNRGKGGALASAMVWAHEHGFSHAICIDADGQHDPDDVPAFVAAARQCPSATTIGVRDMSTAPGSSEFGRKFSNFWIWFETGHKVADSQCGFRVYPVARVVALGLGSGRYEWEVEVLVRGLWAGIGVRDLDCRVYYPPPEERVSSFRMFWDNVRISWLNTRLVTARLLWPPRWIVRERRDGAQWRDGHKGTVLGWVFFVWMLKLVGRVPTYGAMAVMSAFYIVFAPAQRAGILAYLHRVGRGGWLDAWRVFHQFACSLIDRFVFLVHGRSAFEFLHEEGEQARAFLKNDKRGVLFITAHLGNPELGAMALNAADSARAVSILQYTGGADPYMALLRRQKHAAAPPRIISLNSGEEVAAIAAVRALRSGEIVALKGDRVVDDRVAEVDFLGGRLHLPTGPWLLAAVSGAPVIVLGCFKVGGRTYRIITTPPKVYRFTSRSERNADLQRWTQDFARLLEQWARENPLQYYNFHDPWL